MFRAIDIADSVMPKLDEMGGCQLRAIQLVRDSRVLTGHGELAVDENIGPTCHIEHLDSSSMPGFREDDPIDRAAHEIVDGFALRVRVPVRADDDAKIAGQLQPILDTPDNLGGKGTDDVVGDDADGG